MDVPLQLVEQAALAGEVIEDRRLLDADFLRDRFQPRGIVAQFGEAGLGGLEDVATRDLPLGRLAPIRVGGAVRGGSHGACNASLRDMRQIELPVT